MKKPRQINWKAITISLLISISQDVGANSITLKADKWGHFRGIALINSVAMPYMIDTGATFVSVPIAMARNILKIGRPYIINTANGRTTAYETKINSLKIGNVEIKNIEGSITEKLEEVLIGMNALKKFKMLKDNDFLTLVDYNSNAIIWRNSNGEKEELKDMRWEEIKTCDEKGKYCKTSLNFTNH